MRLYKGHQGPVTSIALADTQPNDGSPSWVALFTGSWDKSIRVWNAEVRLLPRELQLSLLSRERCCMFSKVTQTLSSLSPSSLPPNPCSFPPRLTGPSACGTLRLCPRERPQAACR